MAVKKARLLGVLVIVLLALAGLVPTVYYLITYVRLSSEVAPGQEFAAQLKQAERLLAARKPDEALAAYTVLLSQCDPAAQPERYAYLKRMQGRCYVWLGRREQGRKENLTNAVAAFEAALSRYDVNERPSAYAIVQKDIATSYRDLATVDDPETNLSKALEAYQAVLRVYTREAFPSEYAEVQNSLGVLYESFATVGNREENLKKALAAYTEALDVLTEMGKSFSAAQQEALQELSGQSTASSSQPEDFKLYLNKVRTSLEGVKAELAR